MINNNSISHDSKLIEEINNILNHSTGYDAEKILELIKKDYILVSKGELKCKDCFNFQDNSLKYEFTSNPYFCKYYQQKLKSGSISANDCNHYLEGGLEAKKSMAKFHYELTGDDYYE